MRPVIRLLRRLAPLLLPAAALAQTTVTYTWTGAGAFVFNKVAIADANLASNWADANAPVSSPTATDLVFGASNGIPSADGVANLDFQTDIAVHGITLNAPAPTYNFGSSYDARIGIGTGGVTINGSNGSLATVSSEIVLLANQTWNITDATLYVHSQIEDDNNPAQLTKTGTGDLALYSSENTFSGGLDVQAGAIYLNSSSTAEGSTVIRGPVGTGTLTLRDGTALRTAPFTEVTLHNAISLGNDVTLGNYTYDNGISLFGDITPLQKDTTVKIGVEGALFIGGAIHDATAGATSMRFTKPAGQYSGNTQFAYYQTPSNPPLAVLSGVNTYTGGTIADGAGVIFYTPDSIPATGNISAVNNGYLSTGFSGGMETILTHITTNDRASFSGSLGFDTNPDLSSTPTTFADNIDLTGFSADHTQFIGLGTRTYATLTGTITPPSGGTYIFGGSDGTLFVQSDLTQPVGIRVQSTNSYDPLVVYFRGNNSTVGAATASSSLINDRSIVVLDSAHALPALGANGVGQFQMDDHAYTGVTENTGLSPTQFIARLSNYASTSILGLDSANSDGRTISDPIDLSGLNFLFLGTTSHVHLTGTIKAPVVADNAHSGRLSLTGVGSKSWLTIDSALQSGNVTSLEIGDMGTTPVERGVVELTSGASTFAGGTQLNSGYLLLGASSTANSDGIISGPLGTGTLNVAGYYGEYLTGIATSSDLTIHNDITFNSGSALQFGAYSTTDKNDPAYRVRSYNNNGLTLNGNLSGTPDELRFVGNGTFTLNGDNRNLTTSELEIGYVNYNNNNSIGSSLYSTPLVIAGSDTALGSANSMVCLSNGADLQFTTSAPVIGSIMGGSPIYSDGGTDRSYITLAAGSTLTINQFTDTSLDATIGGALSGSRNSSTATVATVNAALVKNGTGSLTLNGQNTYTGGTTINGGVLVAGSSTALGTGTVTLHGGRLGLAAGISIGNQLVFTGTGNVLGGTGTFSTPITVDSALTLSPGNSPGTLTFTNNLTFASGGTASFDISDFAGSAGYGWDQILVTTPGTFAISATTLNPFTFQINSWSAANDTLGALTTDFSSPASLALLTAPTAITGLIGDGQAGTSNLVLNTDNFTAYQGGLFTLSVGGANNTQLLLNFTPVPEPSTYALLGLGLLVVGYAAHRRARRS
ncbi:MAG: autotransporter-associated beta strand repeat-containing protein [Candidatus Didemnitutus sp.]|nr:autotransporter-associated beta strand repeat-containing protein [Candidatus Didemnitutus sp.]